MKRTRVPRGRRIDIHELQSAEGLNDLSDADALE
jgi:hypothetical protein